MKITKKYNLEVEVELKLECQHPSLKKIKHWWYNWKCNECEKRFKWLPNDFYVQIKLKD